MTAELRISKPTIRATPDLCAVLKAMKRIGVSARPSEVAQYANLTPKRTDAALREAERQGLVHVGFWRLTADGKRA